MNKKELYESIMRNVSREVKKALNEEFIAPEKKWTDKLPGGAKRYAERMEQDREAYFKKMQGSFAEKLKSAKSFHDLFVISKYMLEYGYTFPVNGMVRGCKPGDAEPENIYWMSADREYSMKTSEFIAMEKNPEKYRNQTYDMDIYTYSMSWDWWVANIVRCLFYWKAPYSDSININELKEKIAQYRPACPAKTYWPDFFN